MVKKRSKEYRFFIPNFENYTTTKSYHISYLIIIQVSNFKG